MIPGLTSVVAVSAGEAHSVILRSDGTVWTFGANSEGQLGYGPVNPVVQPITVLVPIQSHPTPAQVPGVSNVAEIDAASLHTRARRADGTMSAWGGNGYGQLGVPTFPPLYSSLPVEVGVAAVPVVASRFIAVAPMRVLDTRPASAVNYTGSKPAAGSSTRLTVIGNPTIVVPVGATAVTATLTVTEATAPGFVQAFPTGAGTPGSSSNVNVERTGQTIANAITVPIGADGTITLYSQSGTHLLVDITGYFVPTLTITTGGRMIPVTSTRILDTRPGSPVNYTGAKPGATSITRVRTAGVAPVPATGVSAVVLNVTATEATDVGFVQVGPAGSLTPGSSSNLNLEFAGQTIPNQVIVPIGADGAIDIYSQSGTHLVVDVTAYITSAAATPGTDGLFVPINPTRVLDTRPEGPIGYTGGITPGAGSLVAVDTTIGSTRIPVTGVSAVAANVTITQATAAGFVQAAASGTLVPGASSVLNANTVGQTIANAAVIPVTNVRMDLFAQSGGHLVTDIFGWYTN